MRYLGTYAETDLGTRRQHNKFKPRTQNLDSRHGAPEDLHIDLDFLLEFHVQDIREEVDMCDGVDARHPLLQRMVEIGLLARQQVDAVNALEFLRGWPLWGNGWLVRAVTRAKMSAAG